MAIKKAKKIKLDLRIWLIRGAIVIGVLGLLFYFKNWFVVAWVNNRPITRVAYMSEVDRLAGQQALSTLITKKLILLEAKKRNLTVSQDELNAEMTTIEGIAQQQGMSLDDLLKQQDLTRPVLLEEIRIQKLLEKMAGQVEVTDEELQTAFQENQTLYPEQTFDQVKIQLTNQLEQQKISDAVQALISKLQQDSKVVTWL
ncbi:MAG TPA: hypothetical protein VJ242_00550 [Patescibacteria group bacterium]|nr:hypothetical protein [Patescibacteria group bacterium]